MGIFNPLVIGDLKAERPVIQGGMGVGISLSSLAGAVAKAGGIGIISTAQIGFRDPDFLKAPLEANLRAIKTELDKARALAPKGILGFNIMVATKNYALYVKEAVKAAPASVPSHSSGASPGTSAAGAGASGSAGASSFLAAFLAAAFRAVAISLARSAPEYSPGFKFSVI